MSSPNRSHRSFWILALVSLGLMGCMRVVLTTIDPGDTFDAEKTPPAPDYRSPDAWATMPGVNNRSRTALPGSPAIDPAQARVDVFFVHTTTMLGRYWNAPIEGDDVAQSTDTGSALIQESVFNHCCRIFTPRYRQANGEAFLAPSLAGAKAAEVAYQDVARAFQTFQADHRQDRPFFLAAHSQGSVHAGRLLREVIAPDPALRASMIAAYIIGGPLGAGDLGGIPHCRAATDTGCVIAFNARSAEYTPSELEFAHPIEDRLCVNPLDPSAAAGETVNATQHAGAVFFDSDAPTVLPNFTSARCARGRLIVEVDDWPDRGFMPELLMKLSGRGNYHPIEYQMFYMPLRQDIQQRTARFLTEAP